MGKFHLIPLKIIFGNFLYLLLIIAWVVIWCVSVPAVVLVSGHYQNQWKYHIAADRTRDGFRG